MKLQNRKFVAITSGVVVAFIIWFVMKSGKSGSSPKVEVEVLHLPQVASIDSDQSKNKSDPNQVPGSKQLIQRSRQKQKDYFEMVGFSKERLEMNENLVTNRVRLGLSRLQRGTFVTEAKRMSNLGEAYKHLINNEVFMDSNFPIWGIESEQYFVFSGYPNCDQEKAFRSGYAVKKDDGGVFRWWLQDDE